MLAPYHSLLWLCPMYLGFRKGGQWRLMQLQESIGFMAIVLAGDKEDDLWSQGCHHQYSYDTGVGKYCWGRVPPQLGTHS